jgi:Leucine-rich repeat (LRR) protein
MKSIILLRKAVIFALVIGGIFSSCKKDDPAVPPETPDEKLPTVEVSNAQLKAALVRKGFTFDEQGLLVKNDSVLNLTALDISNCELSDASGLEIFPKLEEVNLADNKFFYSFDFSVLPASVTRVDLTGNEIYEFPGLITVVIEENDDETVTLLRPLTKIHLPYSARYNCKELVYLYEQLKSKIDSGEAEIKIDNAEGQLSAYNTLREVPNDITRARLQLFYPLFFEGDYIDIGKRVTDAQARKRAMTFPQTNTTVEGAQYIVHHRDFEAPTVGLQVLAGDEHTVIPYLKIPSSVTLLLSEHVDTPNGIDFSEAEKLYRVYIYNNRELKTLDLSKLKDFGQRAVTVEYHPSTSSNITLAACTGLEEIVFPETATGFSTIQLYDLPALKTLDLKRFETIYSISLALLPANCNIIYPEIKKWFYTGNSSIALDSENGNLILALRRDIAYRDETKNFIRTYRTHLTGTKVSLTGVRVPYDQFGEEESYLWISDNNLLDNL